ncbi:MAG: glycosyl transferase [Bacteroidetes bacterium CG2_30_33_31]|nr:MAG: glycosyl transferase [Bacteroidetes bacterium CG2_30_33_31]
MTKVLIVRFSSIGDIVLTSPIIRALKLDAGIEVHFVLKSKYAPVLINNPYVDKLYTFENEITEILSELKQEHYDHIIDLHKNLRSMRLKQTLGVNSQSFNKINIEKWLKVNLKINALPEVHIVERYFDTIKFLDVKYDGKGLDYFVNDEDRKAVKLLPENFKNAYNVFVVGAAHFTKQITEEQLIKLANLSPLPVVLIGAKEDMAKAKSIAMAAGNKVFDTCGKLSLNQSAAIVESAEKVITPDTGFMHIAAAFSKNIISFWGNTIPEFGMYPLLQQEAEGTSKIMEVKNLNCRPCSKIGFEKCPKKHFKCMRDIDLENIF